MTDCEWNPDEGRPALSTDKPHAPAEWSVGSRDNYHLCAACADLPRFKRRGRRPLRRDGVAR